MSSYIELPLIRNGKSLSSSPNFNAKRVKDTLTKRNNIIVLVALFTLITGSIFSLSLQYSEQDEPTYIINQGNDGTYNQTRSGSDSVINNGGFYIRFINGTNNPVILANSTNPLYGVNVTISDTTGGSETHLGTYNITLANGVTINNGGFQINMINGTNNPIKMVNTANGVNITISDTTGSGGGLTQAYIRVQDEGTNQTQRFILNFIGSQVSCTDNAGASRTDCTVTGDPITGSGADCQVAFWTSSTNLSGENDLCWDSTNNRLGILTSSRHSSLQVNGSLALRLKIVTTGTYTVTESDSSMICDTTSGGVTFNLPSAVGIQGRIYEFIRTVVDGDACTINSASSQTFDQLASPITLRTWSRASIIIESDGSNWVVLTSKNNRLEHVGDWDRQRTLTNIGTSFVDIYNAANSAGNPLMISTFGKTSIRFGVQWNKIGTGTQTVQLVRCTTSACSAVDTVLVTLNVVSGNNDSGFVVIPSSLLDTFNHYKLQAKSTTGADDPIFEGAQILIQ